MNRNQIENLYKINDLKDYKLKTTEDLLRVHGIDFKAIEGYNRLDDLNRSIYEKFIINFLNGLGLESRADLVPKGIYFVEDIEYLVQEEGEDFPTIAGHIVYAIDRNGLKSVFRRWIHKDYEELEITEGEPMKYLRFEYEHQERKEWLHVIKDGKEWY